MQFKKQKQWAMLRILSKNRPVRIQKKRGTQLTALEVLVYRATISEPTPIRREHLTYHLVAKITSFQGRDSKRMLQIFYMKNRKINNSMANIIKNI